MLCKEDAGALRFYSSFWIKLFCYFKVRKSLNTTEQQRTGQYFKKRKQSLEYLQDGDTLNLGDRVLEILHTPGHTKGSLCILDRTDRILFSGDSISSHVWLFLRESTSIPEYIQSLKKIETMKDDFDASLASHFPAPFKPELLQRLIHCAEHINIAKSSPYKSHLAGNALLYCEGFEQIRNKFGYSSFDEFQKNFCKIDLKELAELDFASIAYAKHKLH